MHPDTAAAAVLLDPYLGPTYSVQLLFIVSFIPPNKLFLEMKMRISKVKKKNLSRHAAGEWQYLEPIAYFLTPNSLLSSDEQVN